ncbi:MAG TPA: ABC transporter permease [Thermoanaerobaculia bacterium]|nr:ABC transporter permease [Thermoanaerobaculia bacterium]
MSELRPRAPHPDALPRPRPTPLVRLALRLLPQRFRAEYGAEMLELAAERELRAAAGGRKARLAWRARTCFDLIRTALAERLASSFTPTTPPTRSPRPRPRGERSMSTFWHDFRLALRGAWRRPSFSLLVAGTLALGIGTSTAIFTVVHGVLLQPLPFDEPEDLVRVHGRFDPESGFDFPEFPLSVPEYLDYRAAAKAVESVALYRLAGLSLTGLEGGPERVRGAYVTPELQRVLRVEPVLGRGFLPEDGAPEGSDVLWISHRAWQDRFGGGEVLGHRLTVDGRPRTVVGVMPDAFRFPQPDTQLWLPLRIDPANPGSRQSHGFRSIARLEDGVALAAADAEMRQIMAAWQAEYPDIHTGHYLFLRALHEDTVGAARTPLLTLLLASGLVLLIVCANVASIVLAKGEDRGREIGVRAALGASRPRLVQMLLLEGLTLAATGGLLGLGVARLLVRALLALEAGSLPRSTEVTMSPAVLVFALAATAATAILFTLLPAFQATSAPQRKLAEATLRGTASSRRVLFRQGLVAAEVALSFLLVLGAGLLIRSLNELLRVDPGFQTQGILVAGVVPTPTQYPDSEQAMAFWRELLEKVRALPGVERAAVSSYVPMMQGSGVWDFDLEGHQARSDLAFNAVFAAPGEGYFEVLGVPLRSGRVFDGGDRLDAEPVAVVNEEFVRRFLPGVDPLGERIRVATSQDSPLSWARIVGVVGDGRGESLDKEPMPVYYFAHEQTPSTIGGPSRGLAVVMRTTIDPAALVAPLRATLREIDPELPLISPQPMTEVLAESTARQRFTTVVLAVFAAVALLLGASGIYGVLAFAVAQRRREIGIRTALGARPVELLRLVARQGLLPVWIGLLVGGGASFALARLLSGLLYGIEPTDPTTYALVALGVIVVALLACWSPAVRALRLDPTRALRAE